MGGLSDEFRAAHPYRVGEDGRTTVRKRTIVVAVATLTAAAIAGGIFGVRRSGDANRF